MTDILWRSSALSTRTPEPVVAGLMWFTPSRNVPDSYRRIRHACEQNQVGRYGWQAHDGATFGTHELVDGSTTLTTSFVKYPGGYKGTKQYCGDNVVQCDAIRGHGESRN